MKKGESISMSVIIIAAIALLVLVVLAVLVLRAGTGVGQGTGCEGAGGQCGDRISDDQACQDGYAYDIAKSGRLGGCGQDKVCCIRVQAQTEE
jgi:hypothetical protein